MPQLTMRAHQFVNPVCTAPYRFRKSFDGPAGSVALGHIRGPGMIDQTHGAGPRHIGSRSVMTMKASRSPWNQKRVSPGSVMPE